MHDNDKLKLTLAWLRYLSRRRLFTMSSRKFERLTGRSARSAERDFKALAKAGLIERKRVLIRKRADGSKYKVRRFELVAQVPEDVLARQAAKVLAGMEGRPFKLSYLRLRLACTTMQAAGALARAQREGLLDYSFDHAAQTAMPIWVKPVDLELPPEPQKPPRFDAACTSLRERYLVHVRALSGKVPGHADASKALGCGVGAVTRLVRALKAVGLVTGRKQNLALDLTKVDPLSAKAKFGKARYDFEAPALVNEVLAEDADGAHQGMGEERAAFVGFGKARYDLHADDPRHDDAADGHEHDPEDDGDPTPVSESTGGPFGFSLKLNLPSTGSAPPVVEEPGDPQEEAPTEEHLRW